MVTKNRPSVWQRSRTLNSEQKLVGKESKMRKLMTICAVVVLMLAVSGIAGAATSITIEVSPGMVPDENLPAINYGDAPTGFGPDSWQNTQTGGKVNWHARYLADGDALSALFPAQAATLTINDIASISYWTKRPDGTTSGEDWATFIYTRPFTGGDSSWYGYRFVNNYNEHTNIGDWTEYSTDSGMTFRKNSGTQTSLMSFTDLQTTYGNELVEMISVQTMSNYTSFDGYMDGLTITLTDGSVGSVNFVPEPATLVLLGLGGLLLRRRK